ncbi:hypothetical protein C0Z17_08210 [Trinickia caryophylli]|nr:hypothetical protein C0Z17_08210 [Trinickia caryophylli]
MGVSAAACAKPSIDFVLGKGVTGALGSIQCLSEQAGIASRHTTVQGQQVEGAVEVPLQPLLAGGEGKYTITCTVVEGQSGGSYTAQFEGVKFREGKHGTEAARYDEHGFAYGVKIPISQTINACYDKWNRVMIEPCMREYYGKKRYYLSSTIGIENVRFEYNAEYSSNVGVFIENNPKYSAP